jgi:hypothetical protein
MIRAGAALLAAAASLAGAQTAPSPAAPAAKPSSGPQILFSRSLDDTPASTVPKTPGQDAASSPSSAAEPEQQQITFLSYDFDLHLQPAQNMLAARARIVLRNDGAQPLHLLPLQISSGLAWQSIRVAGQPASFTGRLVDSDADHTGMLQEADITLPQPLAPKQTLALDVIYQGSITLSAQRLEEIGVPTETAEHSDWDRIDSSFVGLRGFGNVVWYPVSSSPVLLGDGNKLFTEVDAQKLRQDDATVSMRLTEEFFGAPPNLAVLDGVPLPVAPASMPKENSVPGIVTCSLPKTRLGFATPSLFLLSRTEASSGSVRFFARPEDTGNEAAYAGAAKMVSPTLEKWLTAPRPGTLTIVDLPEAGDVPLEQGSVFFLSLDNAQPADLSIPLIHALSRVTFHSRYPWLEEGVSYFMATLWTEQSRGREAALTEMDNERGALALVEPDDQPAKQQTGAGTAAPVVAKGDEGENLLLAKDPIYYRVKAAYVFWMLRDLAGDSALAQAFREYDPSTDNDGKEFERVLERTSGKDLSWFFSDWVYRDRGLPDLSIAGVYPSSSSVPGSYLVAVSVSNSGGAAAEVPVTVRSSGATVTARLRVPADSSVTHRFLLSGEPVEVAVNDGSVPEVQASVHRHTISNQP